MHENASRLPSRATPRSTARPRGRILGDGALARSGGRSARGPVEGRAMVRPRVRIGKICVLGRLVGGGTPLALERAPMRSAEVVRR